MSSVQTYWQVTRRGRRSPLQIKGKRLDPQLPQYRCRMRTIRWASLLVCAAAGFGGQSSGVNVEDIIRKSVAATDANWKEAPKYTFHERDVLSKKDRPKGTKTYQVLMIDGSPYNKVIAVNDHPLSKEEQQVEEEKLRDEVVNRQNEGPRARSRRIAKYEKERAQDQAMMREMAEAFNFKLVRETKLDGRDVYELEATPKPGYVPRTHETKVLTGMKGTLWVDKETDQWVKVVAEVTHSVSFYGFFAKVGPGTRFELEQEPVGGNLWLPRHFAVRVNASALGFINENSTDDETYSDYRPMSQALAMK